MGRKYEQPFYSIQFLEAEPVQIGDLQMNAEAVKADLERYIGEFEEYGAQTRDLDRVKEVLTAEYHKQGLNGKMALESFFAQEIAAFNRKTREDTPEGVEPKLLTLNIPTPDPPLAIEYLTFPVGKNITITDVQEYIQEAQFKGGLVKSLGLLNMKDVEAYASDPDIFIFTALDSAGLNMGDVEELLVDPSKGDDDDTDPPADDDPPEDPDLLQDKEPPGEDETEPAAGLSTAEVARALAAKDEDAAVAK